MIAMSLLLFLPPPSAASSGGVSLGARVGFDGWILPGAWSPLRVEITASQALEGTLVVEVPGALRTDRALRHTVPLHLPAGAMQQVGMDIIIRDPRRPLLVRVLAAGREHGRLVIPLGAARTVEGVVLALTRERAGLEFLAAGGRKLRPAYVREQDLPSRWQSYAGVAAVVIRDLDPRSLGADQQRALTEWIAQGGRLLVTMHDGLDLRGAAWLARLLPVEPPPLLVPSAGHAASVPVPLVPLLVRPEATRVVSGGALVAAFRTYGRGTVEAWAFDPFAPGARVWPGRLRLWQTLLSRHPASLIAQEDLASQLPQTRALPGSTQFVLAVLSVVYIAGMRGALRRFARIRGGWVAIAATIAIFGVALYAFASGARAGATAVVQVTVFEALPGIPLARVTTYASLLAPYGGRFALRAPSGVAVRPLDGADLSIDEARREITGGVPSGHVVFEATDVVPMDVRVTGREAGGVLEITLDWRNAPSPLAVLLYRQRQIYPLPEAATGRTMRLDPARWEPLERSRALGTADDTPVLEWLTRRLDHLAGADLWLLARLDEERYALHLERGRPQMVQLLAVPLRVR